MVVAPCERVVPVAGAHLSLWKAGMLVEYPMCRILKETNAHIGDTANSRMIIERLTSDEVKSKIKSIRSIYYLEVNKIEKSVAEYVNVISSFIFADNASFIIVSRR
ncbi:hypothetical protein PV328_008446 [Microctonus aethiopoides]|uniref:Uncharacterized protein n=1 Tax=Microctonus aethiopoides TaxID=144406 RepID=A0AA39FJC7_9HYME|nr:hypothetical protein PV328_008446 [Microctonus aethiopoides]